MEKFGNSDTSMNMGVFAPSNFFNCFPRSTAGNPHPSTAPIHIHTNLRQQRNKTAQNYQTTTGRKISEKCHCETHVLWQVLLARLIGGCCTRMESMTLNGPRGVTNPWPHNFGRNSAPAPHHMNLL